MPPRYGKKHAVKVLTSLLTLLVGLAKAKRSEDPSPPGEETTRPRLSLSEAESAAAAEDRFEPLVDLLRGRDAAGAARALRSHAFTSAQSVIDAGAIRPLVDVLRNGSISAATRGDAAGCVANLAHDPAQWHHFEDGRAVEPLVDLLATDATKDVAAGALRNLSRCPILAARLRGAVPALLEATRRGSTSAGTALRSIALSSDAGLAAVARGLGCDAEKDVVRAALDSLKASLKPR